MNSKLHTLGLCKLRISQRSSFHNTTRRAFSYTHTDRHFYNSSPLTICTAAQRHNTVHANPSPPSEARLLGPIQQPVWSTVRHHSVMSSPKFSPGSDPISSEAVLTKLLPAGGGRWSLTADGQGIERSFRFKTFAKTWDFMTAVSLQCKIKNHHPEWSNAYNTTFIRWTTHSPRGLSTKDLDLAAICDAIAEDFGEIVVEANPEQQQQQQQPEKTSAPATSGQSKDLADLANQAVDGDCGCGPK